MYYSVDGAQENATLSMAHLFLWGALISSALFLQ